MSSDVTNFTENQLTLSSSAALAVDLERVVTYLPLLMVEHDDQGDLPIDHVLIED